MPTTENPADTAKLPDFHEAARPGTSQFANTADLRELARQLAASDAATGMYGDPYLASHGAMLAAEAELYYAITGMRRDMEGEARNAAVTGLSLRAAAEHDEQIAHERLEDARTDLADATAQREAQERVLKGDSLGEHDGRWTQVELVNLLDATTVAELDTVVRRRSLFYGLTLAVLGVIDVATVYMAMRNLAVGVDREIAEALAVFAALIAGGSLVVLSHFAGHLAKNAARLPRGRVASALAAVGCIGGALTLQLVLAVVRAGTKETFQKSLVEVAHGQLSVAATIWLAATGGVSLVSAWVGWIHRNPHRSGYIHSRRAELVAKEILTAAQRELADARTRVAQRTASEIDVPAHWAERTNGLEEEYRVLVSIYRRELARRLADPDITTALETAPIVVPGRTGGRS